ncbi:MAG: hypothetical protein CR972_02355 [Candidatus Moraniibacteriota bacterium]|nr:MAG: hypothetical protein CR972_02355 [Candidatus Moranbacteria bacterium]
MKKFILKYQHGIFAVVGAVVVLWQMLLPGYVLLLDWIAGPSNVFSYYTLSDIMHAPSTGFIYFLQMFLSAWFVQKIFLFGLFFVLFYFPLKFHPKEIFDAIAQDKPTIISVKYFTSVFFACNPFVYERFLAGQWRVIIGYAFMFPMVYYLFKFWNNRSWHAMVGAFATLFFVGIWSVHFLVIGGIMFLIYVSILFVANLKNKGVLWDVSKKLLFGILVFMAFSSYWIVPYMLQNDKTVEYFDASHQKAFATAIDPKVGALGNVITLRGFWGESHAWADQFVMPGDNTVVFYMSFFVIITLSIIGIRILWRDVKNRGFAVFLGVFFMLSVIFSAGISVNFLWKINEWLFENVSFWSGFRDTQKWSGISAMIYVLLASVGVNLLVHSCKNRLAQKIVLGVCLLLPISLVSNMPFGFSGQIHSVQYPEQWHKVNVILKKDDECKMIFLPWHQYYSVKFNSGMLIANPAKKFFDCIVVTGHNTELGGIASIAGDVKHYHEMESFVMSNNPQDEFIEKGIAMLRQNNVRYIVWTNDLEGHDLYRYPFLHSSQLEEIYNGDGIVMYKIK